MEFGVFRQLKHAVLRRSCVKCVMNSATCTRSRSRSACLYTDISVRDCISRVTCWWALFGAPPLRQTSMHGASQTTSSRHHHHHLSTGAHMSSVSSRSAATRAGDQAWAKMSKMVCLRGGSGHLFVPLSPLPSEPRPHADLPTFFLSSFIERRIVQPHIWGHGHAANSGLRGCTSRKPAAGENVRLCLG
jgi:hypothetical protein